MHSRWARVKIASRNPLEGSRMSTRFRFLEVKVKPNARASSLRANEAGVWFAELRSAPTDGKANAELIELVAKHFNCAKSSVSIKRGASSRLKLLKIEGL